MTQAAAEVNFLNKAKWLDMYGVELQPVLDEKNVDYLMGLTPTGIVLYQSRRVSGAGGSGGAKVSSYFWPRISKLTYRGNKLMLRVLVDKHRRQSLGDSGSESATECTKTFTVNCEAKALWRSCVEHHRFFRIKAVYEEPAKLNTAHVMSKQSRRDSDRHDPSAVHIKRVPAKRKQTRNNNSSMASAKATASDSKSGNGKTLVHFETSFTKKASF